MWSNGLPYIFTNWNQSEPSQKPGENCVLSHNNKWKDTSCKIRLPFLCEKIIGDNTTHLLILTASDFSFTFVFTTQELFCIYCLFQNNKKKKNLKNTKS